MRLGFRLVWVLGLVFLANAGCIEVSGASAVLDLVIEDAEGRLEGVRVCEGDTGNCAVSDVNGEVTLEVPAGEEIFYTLQKERYDSFLFADVIPESGSSRVWYLQTDEEATPFHEEVMSPYPRQGTGGIQIFLVPAFAGATFDLVDATGKTYYEPYQNPWNPPPYTDPDLVATSEGGAGGFVEITAPGTVQIEFGGSAQRCLPETAWPGDVENRVRVPVREDHLSIVFVNCPLPR